MIGTQVHYVWISCWDPSINKTMIGNTSHAIPPVNWGSSILICAAPMGLPGSRSPRGSPGLDSISQRLLLAARGSRFGSSITAGSKPHLLQLGMPSLASELFLSASLPIPPNPCTCQALPVPTYPLPCSHGDTGKRRKAAHICVLYYHPRNGAKEPYSTFVTHSG